MIDARRRHGLDFVPQEMEHAGPHPVASAKM
jgi:hypothetical protein